MSVNGHSIINNYAVAPVAKIVEEAEKLDNDTILGLLQFEQEQPAPRGDLREGLKKILRDRKQGKASGPTLKELTEGLQKETSAETSQMTEIAPVKKNYDTERVTVYTLKRLKPPPTIGNYNWGQRQKTFEAHCEYDNVPLNVALELRSKGALIIPGFKG